ncbi:MEDS domain-containing protein [Nitrososphaera viennensis]|nr:MEDS domain-containing protein [Nitrososphaera viennensis]UVS70008.1 MEDS domain-containing protein [Nitrososphaera viennensis]
MALFYDSEQQRDDEIIRFINEGLAGGQLCIYGTMRVAADKEYFKAMSCRITNYEQNVKAGNLMIIDFVPFYDATLKQDLTPYKKVQEELEKILKHKKDMKVRYVGDATGYLFKNKHFDECFMIESWWQASRFQVITTLCLFQKSLMGTFPFDHEKNRIIQTHDVVLGSPAGSTHGSGANQKPIAALRLREELTKIETLVGGAVTELLADELKRRGVDLSSNESYFLDEIHAVLEALFGTDATKLIMERLKRGFSEQQDR